jgi:hypothetical protein
MPIIYDRRLPTQFIWTAVLAFVVLPWAAIYIQGDAFFRVTLGLTSLVAGAAVVPQRRPCLAGTKKPRP